MNKEVTGKDRRLKRDKKNLPGIYLMMQLKMQLIFMTINVHSYICVLLDEEQIASYRPDCGILS